MVTKCNVEKQSVLKRIQCQGCLGCFHGRERFRKKQTFSRGHIQVPIGAAFATTSRSSVDETPGSAYNRIYSLGAKTKQRKPTFEHAFEFATDYKTCYQLKINTLIDWPIG